MFYPIVLCTLSLCSWKEKKYFYHVETKTTIKKNHLIMAFCFVVLTLVVIRFTIIGKNNDFDTFMRHTASELNKTCPQQLDRETWLDSATVLNNKTFRYNYTLQFPKDSIEVEMFVLSVRPLMVSNAKTNSDLQVFRDNEVIFEHYFRDLHGKFFTRIHITPEEYLK